VKLSGRVEQTVITDDRQPAWIRLLMFDHHQSAFITLQLALGSGPATI
jgi:hypothetical protein